MSEDIPPVVQSILDLLNGENGELVEQIELEQDPVVHACLARMAREIPDSTQFLNTTSLPLCLECKAEICHHMEDDEKTEFCLHQSSWKIDGRCVDCIVESVCNSVSSNTVSYLVDDRYLSMYAKQTHGMAMDFGTMN